MTLFGRLPVSPQTAIATLCALFVGGGGGDKVFGLQVGAMPNNAIDDFSNNQHHSSLSTTSGEQQQRALESPAMKLLPFIVEYFHFHGVRSLIVVACPDKRKRWGIAYLGQRNFIDYIRTLMVNGFFVRIYCGVLQAEMLPFTHKTGVLILSLELSCSASVLRLASEQNYFTTNRFWLLMTPGGDSQWDLLKSDAIFIPPDGEVRLLTVDTESAASLELTLIDVYKVAKEKPLKERVVGHSITTPMEMIKALLAFGSAISYRENLEGKQFNTGLVIAYPDMFTNIDDLSLRHIDTISKVNHALIRELKNKFNVTFNTYQTDNYGWRQPDGKFDGLVGRIQRFQVDFGQLGIFMRLERIALVDFVAETFSVRAGLMFRQPPLSAVENIFAMPFHEDVWISILFFMIFTMVMMAVELVFAPQTHDMDFWDCVIFVWGAMCQQGFYVTVIARSARILVFTTFVTTLFLFTSFSANIVALLQSPSEAISSLGDLSLSPLEIGVQDTVYNKIFFNESTDPVTMMLYRKKIQPKGDNVYMRPLDGMELMRTKLFAYQVELQAGYQIISDTFSEPEKCGLKQLEAFKLPILAIPVRKNFPYKELFRRQLRWQREVGLMNHEQRKWFPQKPKCEGNVAGFISIGITECRYALLIFALGATAAIAMFFVEILVKKLSN